MPHHQLKLIHPTKVQFPRPNYRYDYIGRESARGTPTTIRYFNSNRKSSVGMVRTRSWFWRPCFGLSTACCTTLTVLRSAINTSRPYYLEMYLQNCDQRCLLLTTRELAVLQTARATSIGLKISHPDLLTKSMSQPIILSDSFSSSSSSSAFSPHAQR